MSIFFRYILVAVHTARAQGPGSELNFWRARAQNPPKILARRQNPWASAPLYGNNIGHYGNNFDGGWRSGHWEVITHPGLDNKRTGGIVISLRQTKNGRTVYLSGTPKQGFIPVVPLPILLTYDLSPSRLSLAGEDKTDEKFIITGTRNAVLLMWHRNPKYFMMADNLKTDAQQENITIAGSSATATRFKLGILNYI